ncbi:hypothetical protein RHMOL_Rhmol12G0019500 [Rhododendron molle]|uniref:Uncharacterized protein n=1 Tax=Rhododendron molle TaxID=49168 RepID=A0ACC0LDT6_RHOML|nr:hypothetical protein RHMOL_Rhmol12G0019500 [Rhododendron molle]
MQWNSWLFCWDAVLKASDYPRKEFLLHYQDDEATCEVSGTPYSRMQIDERERERERERVAGMEIATYEMKNLSIDEEFILSSNNDDCEELTELRSSPLPPTTTYYEELTECGLDESLKNVKWSTTVEPNERPDLPSTRLAGGSRIRLLGPISDRQAKEGLLSS